jgi:hypothetical protein
MVERHRTQRSLVRIAQTAPVRSDVQPCLDLSPSIEAGVHLEQLLRNSNGRLPLVILLGLLVSMFGYAVLSATLPAKAAPRTFFGLSVEHNNTGLRLLWNPSAATLRGVTEAELTIADGDHRCQLLLSPGQIRSGNLFYSPFTTEVRFNLRAQGGARVVDETVLALNQQAGEPKALRGAVTFPAAAWPDLMPNLTVLAAAHLGSSHIAAQEAERRH